MAESAIEKAQNEFLASLSAEESHHLAPCATTNDMMTEIKKLEIISRKGSLGKTCINVMQKLGDRLEPFFKIVEIFVSAKPGTAALVWGSFRFVLLIAQMYTSFFEKLTQLLSKLADTLPQWDEILQLCLDKPHRQLDKKIRDRMRLNIENIYGDIFRIFHIATDVLIRSDGRRKRTPMVLGSLVWKPFDARFQDIIDGLNTKSYTLAQQLAVWQATKLDSEMKKAAAERELNVAERQDAALERELAEEERRIMEQQRIRSSEHGEDVTVRLDAIYHQLKTLESDRKKKTFLRIQEWLAAPNYVDRYEKSLQLRLQGTASWIFEEEAYQQWLSGQGDALPRKRKFGSSSLWIQGNPGAGKTVLAAAIIERLQREDLDAGDFDPVHYYFFDHHFPTVCGLSSALRSIAAQMIWRSQMDGKLLDRICFLMNTKNGGQPSATDAQVLDILHLCLDEKAILILDGVDECSESELLVQTLLGISNRLTNLRILLLGRVNVSELEISVPPGRKFAINKQMVRPDISQFCTEKLEEMMEDELLPPTTSTVEEKNELVKHLCNGADGMFLWARLMTRCLRSAHLTRQQRLRMIKEVNFPEGLEKMYERIGSVIHASGRDSEKLASKIITWLAFSIAPMSSRQLREAIAAQDGEPPTDEDTEVDEFERCAVMACAGVVEASKITPNSEHPKGASGLRFIHLSLQELIGSRKSAEAHPPSLMFQPLGPPLQAIDSTTESTAISKRLRIPPVVTSRSSPKAEAENMPQIFGPLVSGSATSHLVMAGCCLQHLLYRSPAAPLSGTLSGHISEKDLNKQHCFTTYAAVQWLGHLGRSIKSAEPWPVAVSQHIAEILALLSTFLANPMTLSAWLEAFYLSKYQRKAVKYDHPPIYLLQAWLDADAVRQVPSFTLVKDVQAAANSLASDIQNVVNVWDTQLHRTPEVVWDEMTFFAKSKVFASLDSMGVVVQTPDVPDIPGISDEPVAQMSRTSLDGSLKGILSIWAPGFIRDSTIFTRYRMSNRNVSNDIRWLCEGWAATYQVWRMDSIERPSAKFQLPLSPEDILDPMSQYLDYPMADGLDLPLEIGHDVARFCILRTVYTVQAAGDSSKSTIFSQRLDSATSFEKDFKWTAPMPTQVTQRHCPFSYNFNFSQNGIFLALHESDTDISHLLIFECQHDAECGLLVKLVNKLDFRKAQVERLCFHTNQPLMAFSVVFFSDRFTKHRVLLIWNFSYPKLDIVERELSIAHGLDSMTFSSCGTYLVIQPHLPANSEPTIIPCPQVLSDTASEVSITTVGSSADLIEPNLSFNTRTDNSQAIITTGGQSQELLKMVNSVTTTKVATSSSGTEVTLTRYDGKDLQSSKVLTLPRSAHFEGSVHTILPHLSRDEMFKVSVDMDRRKHYSLRGDASTPTAALIEKHPAFVAESELKVPRTKMHVPGLGRLAIDGLDWKQCVSNPLWPKNSMAIHGDGVQGLGDRTCMGILQPAYDKTSYQTPEKAQRDRGRQRGIQAPIQTEDLQPPAKSVWARLSGYVGFIFG